MPKRKQQQEPDSEQQEEEEVSQGSGSDAEATSGSSDSSDDFPSSDESESEDDEDGEAFDAVNVDFEFFDPQEKDFHGLKALLHTYLDGQEFSCSELVDAIIQQAAVGTVIKCGEDDDPIGAITVLNLQRHSKLKSLKELLEFLLAHCPEGGSKEALKKAWSAPGSGLVVSERLINCPPQLAPPLQQNLFDEIQAAAEDEEEPQEQRDAFKFKQYIMVARVYKEPQDQPQQEAGPSGSGAAGKHKKGKKQKQAPAPAAAPALVYATPEAECFHACAAWSFTFPTPNRPVGKHDLVPHRLVMAVDAAAVPGALTDLEALIAAGEGQGDE